MASEFEVASAVDAVAEGRFRATFPDGWQQGRGAFGGLVVGTLLRAIVRAEPDAARRVRTLIADLAGPALPGEAEIAVETARRGTNQTNLRAELRQEGKAIAFGGAVLSGPRRPGLSDLRPRATPTPYADALVLPAELPGAPVFSRHFEYRLTGPFPYGAGPEPVVSGWVRPREAPAAVDAPLLVALLDAFWPAFFSAVGGPRRVATVSFTAEIVADPATLDPAEPFFYEARTVSDHEGFQLELRELYDARGLPVAMNQQTFAILD